MTHQHGRLHRSCREPACVEARAKYAKRWRLDRERGQTRTTDVEKVRLHVATLTGLDWSARAIAGAAGVSATTITRLLDGSATRIRTDVEAMILAVDPNEIPSRPSTQTTEPFVSRVGTVRRLQALMYMQWRARDLEQHGFTTAEVYNLLHQKGRWVTRSTHDKVAAVYEKLHNTLGPSPKSRTLAMKRGYHGPLDWADIDRDPEPILDGGEDEASEVDEAAVIRFCRGEEVELNRHEKYEAVRTLFRQGWQPKDVAKRIGWSKDHVVKIRDGQRGKKKEVA